MKDFLVMCAKIALGLFIGFVLIFGGVNSFDKKAQTLQTNASNQLDSISFPAITE